MRMPREQIRMALLPLLGLLAPVVATQVLAGHRVRRPHSSPKARRAPRPRVTPLTFLVTRRSDLFAHPGKRGFVGTIARGSLLPIMKVARGRRCKGRRWFEVASGAWICAASGRTSWRLPTGRPQPFVREGRLVPRVVYYARRDGVAVFTSSEAAATGDHDRLVERGFSFSVAGWRRIAGLRFILTRNGELVRRSDMARYRPSSFEGRHLRGRPRLSIGCVIGYKYAPVRSAPGPRARRVDRLRHHSWVQIHQVSGRSGRRYLRIEQDRWIAARHVRVVHFSAPPAGVGPRERWVEVLLAHQTLVAYEGARPVFATLVSTGRWRHQTPRGLFRVRTKVAMAAMNNQKGAGELYRVDDVPWIQYFLQGYALHGTYWHNGFGRPKSHGCINLSPRDARWLFGWAPPRLRTGWMATQATRTSPGLLLRVRRTTRQNVRYRGPRGQDPASLRQTAEEQ